MKVYFTTIKDKTADKIPHNSFYPSRLFQCYKHISCKAVFFFTTPKFHLEQIGSQSLAKQSKACYEEWKLLKGVCTKNGHRKQKHATVFKLLYMNCKNCAQGFGQGVAYIGGQLILRVTLASEE